MYEVKLNKVTGTIMSFHANILDLFIDSANSGFTSIHVGHLKSIEISTDKKGRHVLKAATENQQIGTEVDEQALPRAKELVAAVQEAMKTVKL